MRLKKCKRNDCCLLRMFLSNSWCHSCTHAIFTTSSTSRWHSIFTTDSNKTVNCSNQSIHNTVTTIQRTINSPANISRSICISITNLRFTSVSIRIVTFTVRNTTITDAQLPIISKSNRRLFITSCFVLPATFGHSTSRWTNRHEFEHERIHSDTVGECIQNEEVLRSITKQ